MMIILDECEFLAEPKTRAKFKRVEMAIPPLLNIMLFITSVKKYIFKIFCKKTGVTFLLVS